MDWLDRASLLAISGLLASSVVISLRHRSEPPTVVTARHRRTLDSAESPEVAKRAKQIRALIVQGNLSKAQALADDLLHRFPDEGETHMVLGDIHARRQQLMKALSEYRRAIELNPDYLDKKTPKFQGRKIKHLVDEAQEQLEGRARQGADPLLQGDRQLVYYLLRRIAGSCG